MEGLGNTACSLECTGVFEPCTRLDHLGWLRYLASQARFLVASDRSQVARRRVRLDLGDLGIIEQQLNQSSNQLGSKAFGVMHSPVTGLFRVLLDRFLLPPSVPASRATYDWAYPIGSPFSIAMWSDGLLLKRLASTVPVRQQKCQACFFSAPPLDDMRSI